MGLAVAGWALGALCSVCHQGRPGWLFAAACTGSVVSGNLLDEQRHASPWSSLAGGPECRRCLCRVPSAAV